jgi:hypothetical protein
LTTAALAERLAISDGYARRLLRDLNDDTGVAPARLVDDIDIARECADEASPVPGLWAVSQ